MTAQNRSSEQPHTELHTQERCEVCSRLISVTINRGSGVCSERCRKERATRRQVVVP